MAAPGTIDIDLTLGELTAWHRVHEQFSDVFREKIYAALNADDTGIESYPGDPENWEDAESEIMISDYYAEQLVDGETIRFSVGFWWDT